MSGTRLGGLKAVKTVKAKLGDDFYASIGRKGGLVKTDKPKGFACDHERAVAAGRKGGTISRRGKASK